MNSIIFKCNFTADFFFLESFSRSLLLLIYYATETNQLSAIDNGKECAAGLPSQTLLTAKLRYSAIKFYGVVWN